MLARINPEYLSLTENKKQNMHFDDWVEKLWSKRCNAQVGIYITFGIQMKSGINPVHQAW